MYILVGKLVAQKIFDIEKNMFLDLLNNHDKKKLHKCKNQMVYIRQGTEFYNCWELKTFFFAIKTQVSKISAVIGKSQKTILFVILKTFRLVMKKIDFCFSLVLISLENKIFSSLLTHKFPCFCSFFLKIIIQWILGNSRNVLQSSGGL